ncbi:MAG: UvrD-helicase domain-containing protein [Gammaproteobacteria bacterium]|nr:UvrD-helicase domain-containing protein [Gammaproteobacteria bacterium]
MNDISIPVDDEARRQALDVSRSFIVQAPAGSGKTELLTQRFLALLALVDHPEEVWAVTFTRKAAAEMRRRISAALENADAEEPGEPHLQRTWKLSKAVAVRDQELGWDLAINPGRLQVFTIDGLCSKLVRQMPVLSGFGSVPAIANFPERLYGLAARRTLQSLHDGGEPAEHAHTLLSHLDNNTEQAEQLLAKMLANRDRWLPHVAGRDRPELAREALEAALKASVSKQLARLDRGLPDNLADEIIDVVEYAADNELPENSAILHCRGMDALPRAQAEQLDQWLGIREVLLTQKGGLRKTFTKNQGFPPEGTARTIDEKALRVEMKHRARDLAENLSTCEQFVTALAEVSLLPATRYRTDQWQVFLALQNLLQLAVAHLMVLFQETSEVDYTEIAHRALTALGSAESPSELALHLDYRLKHLLVDEFQDTARSQFDLIEGLVNGWQPDDGRTLFLVGDPMQSIYRFREANVGLFLQARDHGLADVRPEFLRLQCNFRSQPQIVSWSNEAFTYAFPETDDIDTGAVRFSEAVAAVEESDAIEGVSLHGLPVKSPMLEAEQVATLVRRYQAESPDSSIAILVRARTHLAEILPLLRNSGIRYRAVDLEDLREQPVVRDLFALTRALLHLGDRTAWLSVLRAPWCGLTLDDLHALAANNEDLTIWELIINEARREPLSNDGQIRLVRTKMVLAKSLGERGRRSLRRWVEGTWIALGGPACVFNPGEGRNAEAFFALLEQAEADGFADDVDYLNAVIDKLKAVDDTQSESQVQVMTIHKAKGLQFDIVIVPGLERSPARSDPALLKWLESSGSGGQRRLIIAPISEPGRKDSIYRHIARIDDTMTLHEGLRLLYVAATRARHALHLFAGLPENAHNDPTRTPIAGSFLAYLWPVVREQLLAASTDIEDEEATMARPLLDPGIRHLYRFPSAWMLPTSPQPKPWRSQMALTESTDKVEFSWASEVARHVGTVVHRVLQQIADVGLDSWSAQKLDTLNDYLVQMLRMLGVPQAELADAAQRCEAAIQNTIGDERGQWILHRHDDAQNEYELSGWLDKQAQNVILDRTFIADGYRWIIDYKTGSHEGGTVDAFLDTEFERYQHQLEKYARVMIRIDTRPIKLGLYFPMLKGWREWSYRPV